jgi:hypothetical protein
MRSPRARRRLSDSYRFPGFRARQTVIGIFGEPGVRIVTLVRRSKSRLADALTRHGLRTREAEAFLTAWRVAADAATREALLRDPRGAVPAPRDPAVSPLGGTARELQARFAGPLRTASDCWNKNVATQNTVSSDKQPELLRF